MSKGNPANHGKVLAYLEANDIPYKKLSSEHFRIMGAVSLIDLWPSRMTYHIIKSERPVRADEYPKLSFNYDEDELDELLNS